MPFTICKKVILLKEENKNKLLLELEFFSYKGHIGTVRDRGHTERDRGHNQRNGGYGKRCRGTLINGEVI